jgi:hypothetical protein
MPYIGRSTDGFGVRNRFVYVASSGATSVSGADANGATLTFTDGAFVDVYLNGVLLKPTTDYNTSTANTIAGLSALNTSDEVTVVVYDVFTVADMVSATSGGTFVGNVNFNGNIDVDGTANLDVVDIDGAVDMASTLAVTGVSTLTGNVALGGTLDMNGGELILDADADSSIHASSDDTINFKVGGTDRVTMDVNGDVRLDTGDVFFATAGKGICLGATTNADANTLDDYEEGTFTPAADSFSGTMTFTTANYVKIGKLVHVNFKMTSDGNSDTDQVSISGFPFSAVAEHSVSLSYNTAGSAALHSANDPTIPNAMINTAEIMYVYVPTGGAFKYSSMGTGFIRVSGTYITT